MTDCVLNVNNMLQKGLLFTRILHIRCPTLQSSHIFDGSKNVLAIFSGKFSCDYSGSVSLSELNSHG